jgi:siroheme synthase
VEAAQALPWPRIQLRHTLPLRRSTPLHAVILAADATSPPERASHRTRRRRRFVNRALLLLIAHWRAVARLQLEPPLVASMNLEQLMVEKPVSHEMGMIPEIVSRTAV